MKIDIRDLQNIAEPSRRKIERCARYALEEMGEDKVELSVVLVDDSYIRRLNWKYRKINSRTDVLAFPMREGEGLSEDSPLLGDVVISIETAKRIAKKKKIELQKEINLYLIHGILHLLGYKDTGPRNRKKMRLKEKELIRLCSGNP